MKLHTLQILLYCCIYALHGFSQADTNAVNTWNQEALDLAYSEPKRAMKSAEKALDESKRLKFARGEVRALIRMGIIYDVQSKNNQAIDMYEQSLQLAKKTKDQKAIASNLNNLGLIYWKNSELTEALTYLNRAYALFGVLEDEYNMASAANNLGLIYEEMELHDKALSWSRKGLTHAKLANDADLQYDIYSNMGNVFQSIDQQDSSGIYSRKAIEGYRKNGNKYGLGISLCNLAISLKNDGASTESIPLLLESMALAKEIGHEHSYVSSGINLSQAYFDLKQFEKEREVLLKVYPEMLHLKSNELGYKVCYALGKNSYHFGDQEAARTYLEQYENFHAAYFKGIITKNLAEAEKKFQVRAERQQSALKLKEQEQARFIDNLIWMASFVVVIFAGILIFFVIRKRNLQQELINQRSVFDATMEERKRISYDLHDHVGSQLSYVVNNLELIQHSDQANERVKRTFTMSQAAMNSLRDTVWALHSEELTMGALTERMENLARKMLENTAEIELLFASSVPADLVIPQHYTMHIMRVFQEAIHNVYKHAQATLLNITITETAGDISITVSDNGIGIGNDPQKPFHYGLQSMKERAAKINGTLTIQPNANGGTTVELRWSKTILQ
jgi:signal transduction histidine kinase